MDSDGGIGEQAAIPTVSCLLATRSSGPIGNGLEHYFTVPCHSETSIRQTGPVT